MSTPTFKLVPTDAAEVDKLRDQNIALQHAADTAESHAKENCELRAEVERLKKCLSKANEQTEHFEREWYLRGDTIEQQAEQVKALGAAITRQHNCGEQLAERIMQADETIEQQSGRIAELETLRGNSVLVPGPDLKKMQGRIAELESSLAESDAVRDRIAHLLAETAVALKGPEKALHRHGWHDLPQVAAAQSAALAKARDGLERLLNGYRDQKPPGYPASDSERQADEAIAAIDDLLIVSAASAIDRDAVIEEVAKWYAEKGWLLDEDDVAEAIRSLKTASPIGKEEAK